MKRKIQYPCFGILPDDTVLERSSTQTGCFCYENGIRRELGSDETGEGYITDEDSEASGQFYLDDAGELRWHDDQTENEGDTVFVRTDPAA